MQSTDSGVLLESRADGNIVIEATNLGKRFEIYARPRDRLLQSLFRGHKQYFREFWAVSDVTFSVQRGETVGIVGRNGSGKSTLLQLVAGTLTPTTGSVSVSGRVAALLELGSGFNPEYSGRENIFLNGAILGISREAVTRRYAQIVAFADIGAFLDQPVKTYSSGMLARLAFAVAIHSDPEVLIVDEALSVGDEAFQRKCFARIHELRDRGTSILFVSHAAAAIVELCDRAVLVDQGELLFAGPPKEVVGLYQRLLYSPEDRAAAVRQGILEKRLPTPSRGAVPHEPTIGNEVVADAGAEYDARLVPQSTIAYERRGALIHDAHLETIDGRRVNVLVHGDDYVFTYKVSFEREGTTVSFGMFIKTTTGVGIGGGTSAPLAEAIEKVPAGSEYCVTFRFRCLLNAGAYFLNAGVLGATSDGLGYLDRRLDVAMFRVKDVFGGVATGIVNFDVRPGFSMVGTT